MSKFKKVLSLVLCAALLVGSFAFLGDLVVPKAAATDEAVTSTVDSFADLAAKYDKFIYVGVDVYELEVAYEDAEKPNVGTIKKLNGLTDGKVKAGSWLEYRIYIKSDMWIGTNSPTFLFDKRFFDVKNVLSTTVATGTTYTTNKTSEGLVNKSHPMSEYTTLKHTLTSAAASGVSWFKNADCEIDATNLDYVKSGTAVVDATKTNAWNMTSDQWLSNFYVRVLDEPTIDETTSYSPASIWKNVPRVVSGTERGDTRRVADCYSADGDPLTEEPIAKGTTKSMADTSRYNVITLLVDDTYTTFTIDDGTTEEPEEPVEETLTVKFVENDDTVIKAADGTEYVKDYVVDSVIPAEEIPEAAENQYGWADVDTGIMVDMATFTVKELADYTTADGVIVLKRVLKTDTFPVTVDIAGGSIDEADLPENAEIDANGKVVVNAAMGSTIAFADILVPEKIGYTASWEPAEVTVNNLKGASAKVVWTSKNYNVKFFIDEEAAKEGTTTFSEATVQYGKTLQLDRTFVNENLHKTDADGNVMAFDGWMKVTGVDEEGNLTAEKVTTNTVNLGKYETDGDSVYFATWAYSSIGLMVRNLKYTGAEGELEWIEASTQYSEGGSLTLAQIEEITNALDLSEEFGFGVALKFRYAGTSGEKIDQNNMINTKVDFVKGEKQLVYVYADAEVDVTWKIPVYDAETGEATDDFTETISKGSVPAVVEGEYQYPITIKSKTTADTAAVPGYKFVGWVDENGEAVVYDEREGVTANLAEDALEYTGVFEALEYKIVFNVGNAGSNSTLKTVEGTYGIGDEVKFAEVVLFDENNLETELPIAGKENKEQVGGTMEGGRYFNADGYEFNGWKIGSGVNARDFDPEETLVLSIENLSKYANNTTGEIVIRGSWTALSYDLVFKYRTGFDENDQPIYAIALEASVPTGAPLEQYKKEAQAVVEANLPEGETFGRWSNAAVTSMQAYGMEIYAQYNNDLIDVYIDYNTSTEENPQTLEETMSLSSVYKATYGLDIETPQLGEMLSLADQIRRGTITRRPCDTAGCDHTKCPDTFECIGWKIFYVEKGEDPYTATWKEGVNAQGSTVAKTTLIFQTQWKAHSDFFFRVYDTNNKICKALGKDFKMYYWSSGIVCERNEAAVNHLPEGLIVLFYLVEIENWDWNGFFSPDMWSSLTVKFSAYGINKSFFEPDGFAQLMKTLFTFILKEIGIEVE